MIQMLLQKKKNENVFTVKGIWKSFQFFPSNLLCTSLCKSSHHNVHRFFSFFQNLIRISYVRNVFGAKEWSLNKTLLLKRIYTFIKRSVFYNSYKCFILFNYIFKTIDVALWTDYLKPYTDTKFSQTHLVKTA